MIVREIRDDAPIIVSDGSGAGPFRAFADMTLRAAETAAAFED